MKCQLCKRDVELPFKCSYCGQFFCDDHRLPEQHLCPNLPRKRWGRRAAESTLRRTTTTKAPTQPQKAPQPSNPAKRVSTYRSPEPSRPINPDRSLLYFVIIACVAALALYTYQHGVENTLDDISNIASNVTQQVKETTGNLTQTIQNMSKPTDRIYFESVEELQSFLDADNVSDIEWTEDFVCADFTDLLIERAEAAGYNTLLYRGMEGVELNRYSEVMATVSYTSPYGRTWRSLGLKLSGAGHAICETTIGNKTIILEPQNDMIFELSNSIYTVLYKGEMTKYGQKLAETEDRTYFESIDDLILFFDNDNFSKIEWNESTMDWDWESSDWNEVMSGYYNGERFEWSWELLDALSERAEENGCNTLLSSVIRGDELQAYSDALSTISYQSGSTIWSYRGLDLSSVDTKIVFKTTIGNSTIIIAPQTDIIFELKDGKYIVLYKGEITKNEE